MDIEHKRIELKHLLKTLPFTEENFELLKEQLIDSIYPESISEKLEKQMHRNAQELQMKEARAMAEQYKFAMPNPSGIDRNFQEDMINDMDMGQDY